MSSVRVVLILGDGYSGSTLLDLILGSHSRLVGLGEIDAASFDAFLEENQLCSCLFRARECHFWRRVFQRLGGPEHMENFRLQGANIQESTARTLDLLIAVKDVTGADGIVDSSKDLPRAASLADSGAIIPRVIHLLRDGRGVGYSYTKRGIPFEHAVNQWRRKNQEIRDWLAERKPDSVTIKYEDLCAAPIETVKVLCDFLNIQWEPGMMRFGRRIHHNVRGNVGRFLNPGSRIQLDEKWKSALREEDLVRFSRVAGSFSELLGYA